MTSAAHPRDLLLVIHGQRAHDAALRAAVEDARARGHRVQTRVTWEAGDAERFAAEAAGAGHDAVVAVGGDGTVNEVLNGLTRVPRRERPALGVLPLGTANDFALQAAIPDDPLHALDVILTRNPQWLDTAMLNERRFLNVSTGGIGAETTAETSGEAKEALGKLAYAITGVRKFVSLEPRRARFITPEMDEEIEFLLFAVGNTRATGGGIALTPRASTRDGLLDLCIVPALNRAHLARLTLRCRTGEHLDDPEVRYQQVPWVRIEAAEPLRVNVDGEPRDAPMLAYAAQPHDVRVHVARLPDEAPIGAGAADRTDGGGTASPPRESTPAAGG